MAKTPFTELREVRIEGPRMATRELGGSGNSVTAPMWELIAGAPNFVGQANTNSKSSTEDNVHPVRTLLADATSMAVRVPETGQQPMLHVPRLFGAHVIVGSERGRYEWVEGNSFEFDPESREQLRIRFTPKSDVIALHNLVLPFRWKRVRTVDAVDAADASFVHVVLEPQIDPASDAGWVEDVDKPTSVLVPRMPLVAGRIPLQLHKDVIRWLGPLAPPLVNDRTLITLCPDGIEVTLSVPFPGFPRTHRIEGVFLLTPRGPVDAADPNDAALVLRLLPERLTTSQRDAWSNVWKAVSPTENDEEKFPGCRLLPRRTGLPPAFAWRLQRDGRKLVFPPELEVEVSRSDEELVLVGSATAGTGQPEGTATIAAERTRVVAISAQKKRALQQLGELGFAPAAASEVWIDVQKAAAQGQAVAHVAERPVPKGHQAKSGVATYTAYAPGTDLVSELTLEPDGMQGAKVSLLHDERRLAAALREAYGLPDASHQRVFNKTGPAVEEPRDIDAARPFLAGFVPIGGGWLQLPLPNLLPLDPSRDDALLGVFASASVSAIDGYVRYS